jgi:hypothetical protein
MVKSPNYGQSPRAERVTETHPEAAPLQDRESNVALRATLYESCVAAIRAENPRGWNPQVTAETDCEATFQLRNILWMVSDWSGSPVRSITLAEGLRIEQQLIDLARKGLVSERLSRAIWRAFLEAHEINQVELDDRRRLVKGRLDRLRRHGRLSAWKWDYKEPHYRKLLEKWSDMQLCTITTKGAPATIEQLDELLRNGGIL